MRLQGELADRRTGGVIYDHHSIVKVRCKCKDTTQVAGQPHTSRYNLAAAAAASSGSNRAAAALRAQGSSSSQPACTSHSHVAGVSCPAQLSQHACLGRPGSQLPSRLSLHTAIIGVPTSGVLRARARQQTAARFNTPTAKRSAASRTPHARSATSSCLLAGTVASVWAVDTTKRPVARPAVGPRQRCPRTPPARTQAGGAWLVGRGAAAPPLMDMMDAHMCDQGWRPCPTPRCLLCARPAQVPPGRTHVSNDAPLPNETLHVM